MKPVNLGKSYATSVGGYAYILYGHMYICVHLYAGVYHFLRSSYIKHLHIYINTYMYIRTYIRQIITSYCQSKCHDTPESDVT